MKLISLSFNAHDSSLTLLENGEIKSHLISERLSRLKHDSEITDKFQFFIETFKGTYDHLSGIVFRSEKESNKDVDRCIQLLEREKIFSPKNNCFSLSSSDHHLAHAYSGFYSSKFNDALCFIFDGDGSEFLNLIPDKVCREIESIYVFKNKRCSNIPLYKKYRIFDETITHENYVENDSNTDINLTENDIVTSNYSIGNKFEILSEKIGFGWQNVGKLMGLAQYKFNEDKLPDEYKTDFWKQRVSDAYALQISSKNYMINLIKKYQQKTGIKNIVISGGVGLNCVINYHLIQQFPELNFHIDPICSDAGISLGNALNQYTRITNKIPKRLSSVYLGYKKHEYDITYIKNFLKYKKVTYRNIIDLITNGNIIALFQGKSEIGQRSLGNRSLLFDPRNKNGQNIVNKIKKRESFRPFAASILLEHSKDWFDLKSLKESPHMSFAVDAHDKTIDIVPSVIHADGTSRIQTVTKKQNYHFYNLIKEFYKKTSIPMLLNTSFNLSGDPLVETFEDAILTLRKSEIEYLYLPEIKILIIIDNK
jgi:carbamoyltransferase